MGLKGRRLITYIKPGYNPRVAPGPAALQGKVPGVGYSARGQGVRQSVCVGGKSEALGSEGSSE